MFRSSILSALTHTLGGKYLQPAHLILDAAKQSEYHSVTHLRATYLLRRDKPCHITELHNSGAQHSEEAGEVPDQTIDPLFTLAVLVSPLLLSYLVNFFPQMLVK